MNTLPDNTLPSANALYDDEIDLFELFATLWEGKWLIGAIGFFSALLGLSVSLWQPMYKGTAPIAPAHSSVFTKYLLANEILNEHEFSSYLGSENAFNLLSIRFNQYVDLIEVLKRSEYVQEKIKNLDPIEAERLINGFAKEFKLVPPVKDETEWKLQFVWHDENEGKALLSQANESILIGIKNLITSNLDEVIIVESERERIYTQRLNSRLIALKEKIKTNTEQRLLYLQEQATIARELGIESNTLDSGALRSSQNVGLTLNFNADEVPFYLRGYKAIEKELALLSARTEEESLSINSEYVSIRKELITLENDFSIAELEDAKAVIEANTPYDWVRYDLSLAEIKPTKNPLLFVVLAGLLGGMIGCIFVLIRNAVRNRRAKA